MQEVSYPPHFVTRKITFDEWQKITIMRKLNKRGKTFLDDNFGCLEMFKDKYFKKKEPCKILQFKKPPTMHVEQWAAGKDNSI